MPFRTHAQQHEIETRELVCFQPETCAQFLRVLLRRFRGIRILTMDAMHLLRIDRGLPEHRFHGHSEITLRIVRWYMAFVAEKKLDLLPRHHGLQQRVVCQQSVQRFGSRPAGERYRERILFSNGLPSRFDELCGGCFSDAVGIRQDLDFSIRAHGFSSPRRLPAPPLPEPGAAQSMIRLAQSFATFVHPWPAIRPLPPDPRIPPRNSESPVPAVLSIHRAPAG